MAHSRDVKPIYLQVVTDVVNGVREAFLDEGMDEQVLLELKQLWESKLQMSKALEAHEPQRMLPPQSHHHQQQQQHLIPAPAHQSQMNVAAAAPLSHLNPTGGVQMVNQLGLQQMSGAAQAASNALPAGLLQQLHQQQQQRLPVQQQQQFEYCLPQPGGQGQQVFLQGGMGNQSFTLVPTAQTDASHSTTTKPLLQLDGLGDSSSDDNQDDDDDDDDNDDDANDEEEAEEEDPLNSGDDVSDADPTEVFDAENVIVCQFDKINRSKNKWKFHLKDGIMNINGKDQLFMKATGDAEW